MLKRFEL